MEENNNNNENKVVEQGKQIAKDAVKQAVKKPAKQLLMSALPYIGGFFLILLIIGVINAITYMVQSWFASIFNPTKATATDGDVQIQSVISIDDKGAYKVNDDFADELIEQLESKYVDTEDVELVTDNFGNLVKKYIKAEFKTMLPKTGKNGNDLDGNVIIKRQFADGRGLKKLDYIPYDDFMAKIARQDASVLEKFSIKPDNFHLMIAEQASTVQNCYGFDGTLIESESYSSGITIAGDEEEGIDYLPLIQNYGAPFNFFLSLHMVVLDADFMNDFVDMVLKDNSPIELTFVDNLTTETITNNYEGNFTEGKKVMTFTRWSENDEWQDEYMDIIETNSVNFDSRNAKNYVTTGLKDYWKLENSYSAGMLYVTSADTWLKHTEKTIEDKSLEKSETTSPENPQPIKRVKEPIELEDGEEIINLYTKQEKWGYSILTYTETTTTTVENKAFTVVDNINEIKVQEIIDFIRKYPYVVDNLRSAPSQIFYTLEQDESTQKLAQVMRYIIFRLTGVDYGVISEDDLEYLLEDTKYKYASIFASFKEYNRYWEGLQRPAISSDGTKYIIQKDENGDLIVGYGVTLDEDDINLLVQSGYSAEVGGEVDKDYIDSLEEQKIAEAMDYVEEIMFDAGIDLTDYQINALTSREYDYGNKNSLEELRGSSSYNFEEAYKQYWNSETDDKFEEAYNAKENGSEENNIEPDYTHPLFVEYLSEEASNVNKNYSSTAEKRRKSEWRLFQTGYYDVLNKWEAGSSPVGIIRACEEVMYDLLNNNVRYSLSNLVWHDIDKSIDFSTYGCCCATYVTAVLYKAGILTVDEINAYNYNSCSEMDEMLENGGFVEVRIEDAQMGDVCVWPEHTFIYGGDNEIWDQASGCISSKGDAPEKGSSSLWNTYKQKPGLRVWRLP